MFFGLSEEQVLIRDSFRGCLNRVCDLEQVRATAEAGAFINEVIWAELCELGMAGLLVPEAYGGAGFGLLEAVVVGEELGRRAAPVPFVATAVMAPLALVHGGSPEQKDQWLPSLATGEIKIAVAISEVTAGAREDAGVIHSNGRLSGRALFALDGGLADALIVADETGGLHILSLDTPGVIVVSLRTIDRTRSVAEIQFNEAVADPLTATDGVLDRIAQAGRNVLAADSLGAGETMLAQAVDYAGERKQFDRVIGSFQAVKHLCAEMAAELQPCRSLVWYAAYAFDQGLEEAALSSLQAKSHMDMVGKFIARTATEVHGGMGYTDLLGLHYWFKRLGVNAAYLGSPERLRTQAAELQGLG